MAGPKEVPIEIEYDPEQFGTALNGKLSSKGHRYQLFIHTQENGSNEIEVSDLGEIKPGDEFVFKVKIVEHKNNK
ncbi:MAG TPA: hypothetical protein VF185_04575 [Patescibacteria group bacterium]